MQDLDQSYPHQGRCASIPPYTPEQTSFSSRPSAQNHDPSTLPPLPALAPGNLSVAPFTHKSLSSSKYAPISASTCELNYERLEFLGDAYIEIIATRIIYSRFPSLLTGKQARLREACVRNSTLAFFAESYSFGDRIIGDKLFHGGSENGSRDGARAKGGHGPNAKTWEKTMADIFEAYVAAVVLSELGGSGFENAERWLEELWAPLLARHEKMLGPAGFDVADFVPWSKNGIPAATNSKGSKRKGIDDAGPHDGKANTGKRQRVDTVSAPEAKSADTTPNSAVATDKNTVQPHTTKTTINPNITNDTTNYRDALQSAISTRDVTLSYIDEPLPLPTDLHKRSKEEQFHTKQLKKVCVYVTCSASEEPAPAQSRGNDDNVYRKKAEQCINPTSLSPDKSVTTKSNPNTIAIPKTLLGTGIGAGKKEAGMLAARDALANESDVLKVLKERKARRAEERRKLQGGVTQVENFYRGGEIGRSDRL